MSRYFDEDVLALALGVDRGYGSLVARVALQATQEEDGFIKCLLEDNPRRVIVIKVKRKILR